MGLHTLMLVKQYICKFPTHTLRRGENGKTGWQGADCGECRIL